MGLGRFQASRRLLKDSPGQHTREVSSVSIENDAAGVPIGTVKKPCNCTYVHIGMLACCASWPGQAGFARLATLFRWAWHVHADSPFSNYPLSKMWRARTPSAFFQVLSGISEQQRWPALASELARPARRVSLLAGLLAGND